MGRCFRASHIPLLAEYAFYCTEKSMVPGLLCISEGVITFEPDRRSVAVRRYGAGEFQLMIPLAEVCEAAAVSLPRTKTIEKLFDLPPQAEQPSWAGGVHECSPSNKSSSLENLANNFENRQSGSREALSRDPTVGLLQILLKPQSIRRPKLRSMKHGKSPSFLDSSESFEGPQTHSNPTPIRGRMMRAATDNLAGTLSIPPFSSTHDLGDQYCSAPPGKHLDGLSHLPSTVISSLPTSTPKDATTFDSDRDDARSAWMRRDRAAALGDMAAIVGRRSRHLSMDELPTLELRQSYSMKARAEKKDVPSLLDREKKADNRSSHPPVAKRGHKSFILFRVIGGTVHHRANKVRCSCEVLKP